MAIVKPPLTNPDVTDHVIQVAQYVNEQPLTRSAKAAPTTGSHRRGDIIYNNEPVGGGTVGWVCVTAGDPGTWKTFGDIQI